MKAPNFVMPVTLPSSTLTDFQEVAEGQTLRVGKIEARVIETPGHTEGGVCYLIAEGDEKVLASGDTLFAHSVGRTDLDGGDEAKLNASLLRLAKLPDDLRVLPEHEIGRAHV